MWGVVVCTQGMVGGGGEGELGYRVLLGVAVWGIVVCTQGMVGGLGRESWVTSGVHTSIGWRAGRGGVGG